MGCPVASRTSPLIYEFPSGRRLRQGVQGAVRYFRLLAPRLYLRGNPQSYGKGKAVSSVFTAILLGMHSTA